MRRAQTVRLYGRPSVGLGADDISRLTENPEESTEDVLRRQLIEKDRENDRLQDQIQALQAQLAQRPSMEAVQALQKEYTNLEILLQGTQRENERSMVEIERGKAREKVLERELERLAGANWQENLNIGTLSSPVKNSRRSSAPPPLGSASSSTFTQVQSTESPVNVGTNAVAPHTEQLRLLILGMEERLRAREEKLLQAIERAEAEGSRFEERRKETLPTAY
ncbi:uncharacterized protein LAESUDRAFT_685852 [Laetiporus sulphureus 93-53]|uniref:Uncharacterized protein n=1 Tax=Laetiporus sulphureus 93-53 TaxID=1314785 RepID=A0A165C1Y2_9APHY|nr:uncharacterized protein LAESUDRAFT_685852 [Laetiporus sulphureus 93-53]KZT02055.1 hypothetical protein LAESUDRAFT_685852 [Laetiporus sulphureus 93-53]